MPAFFFHQFHQHALSGQGKGHKNSPAVCQPPQSITAVHHTGHFNFFCHRRSIRNSIWLDYNIRALDRMTGRITLQAIVNHPILMYI
jgi:hypothetical protein